MNFLIFRSSLLLLVTAAIWGSTIVVQKYVMNSIGPFWFAAIRFFIASCVLFPFAFHELRKRPTPSKFDWGTGIFIGFFLFGGSMCMQYALLFTTVTNVGFITGLYVAFVPIIGLFFGQRPSSSIWLGIFLSVTGVYFLSFSNDTAFSLTALNKGDMITFMGALFWAGHVFTLSSPLGRRLPSLSMTFIQMCTSTVLCFLLAVFLEAFSWSAVEESLIGLLFVGIISSCLCYTLQIVGQRHVPAAPAAIILSLEAVFSALSGWIFLGETLPFRGFLGCALIFSGLITTQLAFIFTKAQKV